jgi:thioredoxin 1
MDADADGPKESTMSSELIKHVTDASFESDVLQSDKPVLVDYWAEWCGPCKMIAPILDELSTQYDGRLQIAKMNVDENQDVPGKFGIRGIPTLMLFKGGQLAGTLVGAHPKAKFTAFIESHL